MDLEREPPLDSLLDEESLRTRLLSDKDDGNWYSWLTTQEAATSSGYDIQHVRHLAREGKIGAVKRGYD